MRFLADENIPPPIVSFLRNLGHEVKSIKEDRLFRTPDEKIVEMAVKEKRTIITFDKHFGDILRYPPKELSGIIHIRIHPPLLSDIFPALRNLFENYGADSFQGKLVVLSKTGYRIRG